MAEEKATKTEHALTKNTHWFLTADSRSLNIRPFVVLQWSQLHSFHYNQVTIFLGCFDCSYFLWVGSSKKKETPSMAYLNKAIDLVEPMHRASKLPMELNTSLTTVQKIVWAISIFTTT